MRVQVLLVRAGEGRYAIPTSGVVQVIPSVPLRAVPGSVHGVLGLLEFRGEIVPVVDLPLVHGLAACPPRLSTRIVVCDLGGASARWDDRGTVGRRVGVRAEDVTRVGYLDPDEVASHPGTKTPGVPGLGRIVSDDEGLVQFVELARLVPESVLASLVRSASDGSPVA